MYSYIHNTHTSVPQEHDFRSVYGALSLWALDCGTTSQLLAPDPGLSACGLAALHWCFPDQAVWLSLTLLGLLPFPEKTPRAAGRDQALLMLAGMRGQHRVSPRGCRRQPPGVPSPLLPSGLC